MRPANLREQVLEANLDLARKGLVLSTFGNASGVAHEVELVARLAYLTVGLKGGCQCLRQDAR